MVSGHAPEPVSVITIGNEASGGRVRESDYRFRAAGAEKHPASTPIYSVLAQISSDLVDGEPFAYAKKVQIGEIPGGGFKSALTFHLHLDVR
jgi:hypothetical protein